MHTVRVGDKFYMGPWVWEVVKANAIEFWIGRSDLKSPGCAKMLQEDAQSMAIDWIKPEVTFTEEQSEAIKKEWNPSTSWGSFEHWLDTHTEK